MTRLKQTKMLLASWTDTQHTSEKRFNRVLVGRSSRNLGQLAKTSFVTRNVSAKAHQAKQKATLGQGWGCMRTLSQMW